MIILYAILLILILIEIKFKLNSYNEKYISRESTTAIKGIFVLLVFFSHYSSYVDLSGHKINSYFAMLNGWIGQLMVVMFLFYSGYGIVKQIQKSSGGGGYINTFLKHRFLSVWLQFAICICLFIIVDIVFGLLGNYSLSHILLAFTGWTSIGNSNWFMFVTFALYILVYLSFRFLNFKDIKWNIVIFSVLSCILVVILYIFKESHWWNTLLCFPLGMWYGYYKDKVEAFMKRPKNYWLTAVPLVLAFLAAWFVHIRVRNLGKAYIGLSLLFALVMVVITMKVQIGNPILNFFGKHVFSIYILQRITMIIFQDLIPNVYLNFAVCFSITILISVGFDYLFGKLKFLITKNYR